MSRRTTRLYRHSGMRLSDWQSSMSTTTTSPHCSLPERILPGRALFLNGRAALAPLYTITNLLLSTPYASIAFYWMRRFQEQSKVHHCGLLFRIAWNVEKRGSACSSLYEIGGRAA